MNEKTQHNIMKNRELMKGYGLWDAGLEETDQVQKLPPISPVKQKKSDHVTALPMDFIYDEQRMTVCLTDLIRKRKSIRSYDEAPMSLEELSWLLWASQGMKKVRDMESGVTFRHVPSAGARHPLETYLFLNNVKGMKKGIYHYLPLEHEIELVDDREDYDEELLAGVCGQRYALKASVVFAWSVIPYRTEWRYGMKAMKYILIDVGHVCQNLYLAAEAMGMGCCAIGAYDQECMDELLGFMPGPSASPDYEFCIYLASVGKK